MDPLLLDLLHETQSDLKDFENKERNFTHISFFGPHEKWIISPRNHRDFWRRYCDIVHRGFSDHLLCLAERPRDIMPVVVDFYLRFPMDTERNAIFNDLFLQGLAYCCQLAIDELFEMADSESELYSIVLESDPFTDYEEIDPETGERGVLVVQIRVHFPLCRTKAMEQKKILIPKICQILRKHNIRSKLHHEPMGDWDKIIDHDTVIKPLTMFASVKTRGALPMTVSRMFGKLVEGCLDEEFPSESFYEYFDPSEHQHCVKNSVSASIFAENDLDHWIPLFLSVQYGTKETLLRSDQEARRALEPTPLQFGARAREESELEIAEHLLTIVNPERFKTRNTWQYIGMALNKADKGRRGGLHLWKRLTERFQSAWVDECDSLYFTYNDKKVTIKTIAWLAREDQPVRYREWHERWIFQIIEKSLSLTHNDVAKALYRCNWLEFVCCSLNSRETHWYYYESHRWIETKQAMELRRIISTSFIHRIEELRTRLSNEINNSNDERYRAEGENNMKKFHILISKLKNHTFKNQILNEAKEYFENPAFLKNLDSNMDTMGLNNGIIEIVDDRAIFRSGFPEDFISRYANVTYRSDYNWESQQVKDLMNWLGKVFVDRDLLEFFIKFASSCMKGGNNDKIFPIWSGMGNNSKSMIIKLFEFAFGSYCINFPTSLLTGKQGPSSAPTPELARSRNSRIAFLSEPDKDERLKIGPVKKFTGGDTFFTRTLHDEGGDISTSFKMIYVCNKISAIPDADEAVKNRVRIFPFLSTWRKIAPESPEEQYETKTFKMDRMFDKKIQPLAAAFLWLIVQYYPKYFSEGLNEPRIVEETTQQFWDENDTYNQFINESFEAVLGPDGRPDPNAFVSVQDAYSEFRDWFRDNCPGRSIPERGNFVDELKIRKFGSPAKNVWRGIRIVPRGIANFDGR